MTRGPRHTPATPVSPLVRQLARLAGTPAPAPAGRPGLAERLAPWLGLTDAITLAAALAPAAPAAASPTPATPRGSAAVEATRLHQQLAASLADTPTPPPAGPAARRPGHPPPMDTPASADFLPHRRRYHARQQAMDAAVAPLRARLRGALAARSPAGERLAAVDAVMEQALAERERGLLAVVPVLLEKRFEHLRQAHLRQEQQRPAGPAPAGRAEAPWLTTFRHDMHQLLLAELDHRWQPIHGLLAALDAAP